MHVASRLRVLTVLTIRKYTAISTVRTMAGHGSPPPDTKTPPQSVKSIKAATAASSGPHTAVLFPRIYLAKNPTADNRVTAARIADGRGVRLRSGAVSKASETPASGKHKSITAHKTISNTPINPTGET